MRVGSIRVSRFRNIQEATLEPSHRLNFFLGKNGQGKTSLVEAISYLSSLKSFRGSSSDELLNWQDTQGEIRLRIASEGLPGDDPALSGPQSELKVTFLRESEKVIRTAFINGKGYRSSSHFLRQRFGNYELGFHSIVFNPSDHELIRGEPALRRQFLDRVLSAENETYLEDLSRYQKVLEQRNSLLKDQEQFGPRSADFQNYLKSYTDPLIQLGARITHARLKWVQKALPRLEKFQKKIAPNQPKAGLFYRSSFATFFDEKPSNNIGLDLDHFSGQGDPPSIELLEQLYSKKLSDLAMIELRSRVTGAGPHRDDWGILLGQHFLHGHGSQGEVRSALLALKLTEIENFQEETGHRPVLILDDFSSELDRSRREFLLAFLSETELQVFVTATEDPIEAFESLNDRSAWREKLNGKWFRVDSGQIVEVP
ncbi:MAG: DNA replication and repair protein RecF [Bdellovibrionales bacterium]|nr:DNA replication and repair protein RecF [Bdellovibrionales bacterium]